MYLVYYKMKNLLKKILIFLNILKVAQNINNKLLQLLNYHKWFNLKKQKNIFQ